jgi:cysteine desulfurase
MTMPRPIDADHASTTALSPEAAAAMRPFLEPERYGNASSIHARGEAAREAVEDARARVALLIGARPEEIVFTATGSEANNLALQGVLLAAEGARRRLVVTAIEHPSVLETARYLESRGFALTVVPVEPNGVVDPARVAAVLGPDVALVTVMWVNNEVGTIQPVAEIAALARDAGARFHCDAIQAAGKIGIDVDATGADLLSLAGHKFGGPLGAAALWVRRRTRLVPLVHGGHQERGRRAGTENLAAIVGLGAAAERARGRIASGAIARIEALGERLSAGLLEHVPGAALNGDPERRLASIVNVRFPGADGEAVLHELDREGVTVSTGSACSAAQPGPSHVLIAMGLTPEDAHASVRFSLGEDNDEADVAAIVDVVPSVLHRISELGSADHTHRPAPPRSGAASMSAGHAARRGEFA